MDLRRFEAARQGLWSLGSAVFRLVSSRSKKLLTLRKPHTVHKIDELVAGYRSTIASQTVDAPPLGAVALVAIAPEAGELHVVPGVSSAIS